MSKNHVLKLIPFAEAPVDFENYLPPGTVDQVLAAVGREFIPGDFNRKTFARDLAIAYQFFCGREIAQAVPSAAQSRQLMKAMRNAVGSLREALPDPDDWRDPKAWSFDQLALEYEPEFCRQCKQLEEKAVELERRISVEELSAEDGQPSRLRYDLFQVRRKIDAISRVPIRRPTDFFYDLSLYLTVLAHWQDLYVERDAQFGRGEDLPQHWVNLFTDIKGDLGNREHTLVQQQIPAIYEQHFQRPVAVSRDSQTGKLGGPAIRFAESVLAQFGFTSRRTGRPLSPEGIARSWRTARQE